MAILNKFSKFALSNALGAVLIYFLFSPIAILFSLLAIGFGIKGIKVYKRDNSMGGKASSIAAIVIALIMLVLSLGIPLYHMMFPDLATRISRNVDYITEGKCDKLDDGSSSQAYCYGEKAIETNDVSYCDRVSGPNRWSCIKRYASNTNDVALCLQIPSETEGDLAYLRTNCLLDIVVNSHDATVCEHIDKSERYISTGSSYDECMLLVELGSNAG